MTGRREGNDGDRIGGRGECVVTPMSDRIPKHRKRLARALLALGIVMALALPAGAGAAKKAPNGFYGVIPQETISGADYANIAEGRIGTVRLGFNWASFQQVEGKCRPEPQVGVCSWTVMDETIGSLAQAGARVLPTFYGSPSFVSKKPNKPPVKGKDLKLWRAFVESAAARYGRNGTYWQAYDDYGAKPLPITDWQVWNEPNSKQFWYPNPNARKFAKLVKASSKALRNGDKKADVVLGGMFANAKQPVGSYMRDLYRVKKISRFFDEAAVHLYAPSMRALKQQMNATRRAVRGKTGIRVTELGWSSKKGGHPLNKGTKGQAKLLRKSFGLLTRKRRSWNITGLNWFALRDTNNQDTCKFCNKAGLFATGGKAKPSWREFKKFSK